MLNAMRYSGHELWGKGLFGEEVQEKASAEKNPVPPSEPDLGKESSTVPKDKSTTSTPTAEPETAAEPQPKPVNQPSSQAISQTMVESTESIENEQHNPENDAPESNPVKPNCGGDNRAAIVPSPSEASGDGTNDNWGHE